MNFTLAGRTTFRSTEESAVLVTIMKGNDVLAFVKLSAQCALLCGVVEDSNRSLC